MYAGHSDFKFDGSFSRRASNLILCILVTPVATSQRTQITSIRKTDKLKIFREITGIYCENQMKDINTLCRQNTVFCNVRTGCILLLLCLKKLSEQKGFVTKSTTTSHPFRRVIPILSTKYMEEKFIYTLSHFAGCSGMQLVHKSECVYVNTVFNLQSVSTNTY